MISLLDIAERAYKGPRMEEKDWNLSLFRKMQQLVKKYSIELPNSPDPFHVDKEIVNSLWEAALEFLSEKGVYCISTNRVLNFTEEEILEAIREIPRDIQVGSGKDTRTISKRRIEDPKPPSIQSGGHSAWSDDLFPLPLMVRALVKNKRVDIIEGFNFAKLNGIEIHGLPAEAYAARRQMDLVRQGLREAGREGMAVTLYPIHTHTSSLIASIDPDYGLRRTDGILLSILPDIKVETDLIAASLVFEEYGCYRVNGGAFALAGGFCGGIEGAMIESLVKTIAAWIVYRDSIQYSGAVSKGLQPRVSGGTKDSAAWKTAITPSFIVQKTVTEKTNVIRFGGIGFGRPFNDDLCSEELLILTALSAIGTTITGGNIGIGETPPPTTLEWAIETSDAGLGMKLDEDSELILRVLSERFPNGQPGTGIDRRMLIYSNPSAFIKPLDRCYDFTKQRPREAYEKNRMKVRKYLSNLGVPLD